MISLDQGIHYYYSRRYDEGISFFRSLVQKKAETGIPLSKIYLWLGRCYFEKQEVLFHGALLPPPPSYFGKNLVGRDSLAWRFRSSFSIIENKDEALSCFQVAIKHDEFFAEAHYWKGRVLEDMGKVERAYNSYIEAAKLSDEPSFLKKCISLFVANESLPFPNVRNVALISMSCAIRALSSKNAYTRMKGCLAISERLENVQDEETKRQIRVAISPLAGNRLFSRYLPYTGDADLRIKHLARAVMDRVQLASDSCLSSWL